MTYAIALLCLAAGIVLAAILTDRQPILVVGVGLYVTVTIWLAYVHPVLLLPAMGGAVLLEIVGLRRVLRDGPPEEAVTLRHNSTTIVPNNLTVASGR